MSILSTPCARFCQALVQRTQQVLTFALLEERPDMEVQNAVSFLGLLYEANEQGRQLPICEFYNDAGASGTGSSPALTRQHARCMLPRPQPGTSCSTPGFQGPADWQAPEFPAAVAGMEEDCRGRRIKAMQWHGAAPAR